MSGRRWLIVGFIIGSIFSCTPVSATELTVTETPGEYWLKSSPLQISAYQFSEDGSLVLLEVYNDDGSLLDLTTWNISADFTITSKYADKTTATYTRTSLLKAKGVREGKLLPGGHAVIDAIGDIGKASYKAAGWETPVVPTSVVPLSTTVDVTLTVKNDGYKTDTYSFKTVNNGQLFRRNRTTTGYASISSTAFVAAPDGPLYDDGVYAVPLEGPPLQLVEVYAYGEECAPENVSYACGDYLKFKIKGAFSNIEDYVVRTDNGSSNRTSANTFSLENGEEYGDFILIRLTDTGSLMNLTNSGGFVWIEDRYQGERYGDSVQYPSFTSSHRTWSYIFDDDGKNGQWTSQANRFGENTLILPVEEVTTCPVGKYLNPDTGRCRTLEEAVNALAACAEGQERNPATNRCRAKVTAASASLTPCGEGQERNPATNRCRSIASAVAELIPCNEGYERNPATNRCRKVAGASTAAANTTQLVEAAKGNGWNIWTWSLVAVGATGAIGYGVYEWRHELLGFGQKITAKFGKK